MSLLEFWWVVIQVDVSAVEINSRILRVDVHGFIEVDFGRLQIIHVVVGEAAVIIVHRRLAERDSLVIVGDGGVKVFILEL